MRSIFDQVASTRRTSLPPRRSRTHQPSKSHQQCCLPHCDLICLCSSYSPDRKVGRDSHEKPWSYSTSRRALNSDYPLECFSYDIPFELKERVFAIIHLYRIEYSVASAQEPKHRRQSFLGQIAFRSINRTQTSALALTRKGAQGELNPE